MNPRLVLLLLALVAMTTSLTIRDDNEENYDDLVRQICDNWGQWMFSCMFKDKLSQHQITDNAVDFFPIPVAASSSQLPRLHPAAKNIFADIFFVY